MPIVVMCPGCPTKLSAPETAAGKQIRCPKCGAVATVPAMIPAEEAPVEATVRSSPKSKSTDDDDDDRLRKKSRRDADEDEDERPRKKASRKDDDNEEEERPRKKKKKRYADDDDDYDHDQPRGKRKNKSGGGGAMVAVMIGGGLVLLIAVGVVIWLVAGRGSSAKKTPPPKGWEQYSYPDVGFKAYMPARPNQVTMPVNGFGMGGFGGRPGRGGFQGGGADLQDLESYSVFTAGNGGANIELVVIKFRNKVPASFRDQVRDLPGLQAGRVESKTVRGLGFDATEQTGTNGTARIVYTDRHVIVAAITGSGGNRAPADVEAGFFDNFELTK